MIFSCLGNHDAYPADSYIDAQNATEEEVTQYKMYWNLGGFGKHIGKPFSGFLTIFIGLWILLLTLTQIPDPALILTPTYAVMWIRIRSDQLSFGSVDPDPEVQIIGKCIG